MKGDEVLEKEKELEELENYEEEFDEEVPEEFDEEYYFFLRLRKIHRHYGILMENFLDILASDEIHFINLSKILIDKDDYEFIKLTKELEVEGFTREEFLFWFANNNYFFNITQSHWVSNVDDNIERLKKEERYEVIEGLINGDEDAFNIIKQEDNRFHPIFDTYDDFMNYYIDNNNHLRALLKIQGVAFPEEDDDEY